jgi:hypothetical protein
MYYDAQAMFTLYTGLIYGAWATLTTRSVRNSTLVLFCSYCTLRLLFMYSSQYMCTACHSQFINTPPEGNAR